MVINFVQVSDKELVIHGVVPIDEEAPIRADGKILSPDPLIRLCHETKKEILKEFGACVTYCVIRPQTNGDPCITKIKFFFSNTGKYEPSRTADREKISKTENFFCQIMSDRCAHKIVKYFDDKYLTTKNSPF